ncbi:LptE family protein [Penaeicola halotolerans]|uniref:LptE family protein n=1 Tax=Penaeicola halotolerans TaxID=2793196 RepID=UPI001CF8201D|nr:LptE family protein [Penaeicola halotolerans]
MNKFQTLLLLLMLSLLAGCGPYSFTGANIDYNVTKTISVANFYNESGGGPPNINQQLTEDLKDYFLRNTNLNLVNGTGDISFEGGIVRYDLSPQAPVASGNQNVADQSGLMRLTIAIEVTYTNNANEEYNFKRTFSNFEDYDPRTTNFLSAEPQLVEQILEKIIVEIFNNSVATW